MAITCDRPSPGRKPNSFGKSKNKKLITMTHTKTYIIRPKIVGISKTLRVLETSEHKEELIFSTI